MMNTGALLTIAITVIIIIGLFVVPSLIIFIKLFQKAGQPGWAVIVPVYSSIVMARIARASVWLGVTVGLLGLATNVVARISGDDTTAYYIVAAVSFILSLYLLGKFIVAYDRGPGAWLLYIFLPIVGVFYVNRAHYSPKTTQM